MTSKMLGMQLKRGQAVRLGTPGGGGYGAPEARDPAAVARDVSLGFLSADRATALYGDAWKGSAQ